MNRNILELKIYSCGFDWEEFNRKIAEFCGISHIDSAAQRNMELAMEELVKNNISAFIEHNDERGLPIEITFRHYGVYDGVEMAIRYGGERYDPIYDGDELSALLAKKLFASVKFGYDGTNRITVEF